MGGDLARLGFRFQDLYLLLRVLKARADAYTQPPNSGADSTSFGIEAKSFVENEDSSEGPAWDILIQCGTEVEIIEAKSGTISRQERSVFWRRLRSEHATPSANRHLIPVLVVDPNRVGDLGRWQELAPLAKARGGECPIVEPKSKVLTPDELLNEAVWWLSGATNEMGGQFGQPLPVSTALELVSRLRVKPWVADDLEDAVSQSIELLFADGMTSQVRDLFLGWLGGRAVTRDQQRRFFTMTELLDEMNIRQFCASLFPSTLTEWRSLWEELPSILDTRVRTRLGQKGATVTLADAQPALMSALAEPDIRLHLFMGQAGAGKTNTLVQCARQAQDSEMEVFYSPADAVNAQDLETLIKSLRFRRALSSIRTPSKRFWLGIDGLDEVDETLRERWAQHLSRMALDEKTTVIATVREATWNTDARLRHHLHQARHSLVSEWPVEQVRGLLNSTSLGREVTPALFELLRQPLFLDLFWRTFVEKDFASSRNLKQTTKTRHGLLTAFWRERVLNSNRQRVSNLFSRLEGVLVHATSQIGGFSAPNLDEEVLTLLQSESVVVPEGSLNPRFRFRHPLLRDFAFALWCLRASTSDQVVARWQSIKGGIQQQGALRAILEAMLDADAENDFSHLAIGDLFDAFLRGGSQAATRLAQLLGTMPATMILDPALWPKEARDALPPTFGRELLVSAKVANNSTWAERVVKWPLEANWLDTEFAQELYQYTDSLHRIIQKEAADFIVYRHAQHAARKLRDAAEHARFTAEFVKHNRWLKAMALCLIAQLIPDQDTISCWEREMPMSSWMTREFPLDHLIYIAGVNAKRAADIYRSAVGLVQTPAGPRLDPDKWQSGLMDHHAINWSLDGEVYRRSLLAKHPEEFFSVALELVEALLSRNDETAESISDEAALRDDLPPWDNFWNRSYDDNFSDRCLRLIHRKAKEILSERPKMFFDAVCPLLANSRSTSIHSIYLDLIIRNPENADCSCAVRRCIFDPRVYRARSLAHWVETAVKRCWPELSPNERSRILGYIDAAADDSDQDPASEYRRAQILANLPLSDLPLPHQRAVAASLIAQGHHTTEHPASFFSDASEVVFTNDEHDLDAERAKGWPAEFDLSALQALSKASRTLTDGDVKAEVLAEYLPRSIVAMQTLLPALVKCPDALLDHEHFWAWYGLEASVNIAHLKKVPDLAPPNELLLSCARLALDVLETGSSAFQFEEPDSEGHRTSENAWVRALNLADEVLVWAAVLDDAEIQARFEQVLRDAFATNEAAVQIAVVSGVRPFHWVRTDARRSLQDELIWNQPRHNQVLIMALRRLGVEADARRSEILTLLLKRDRFEVNAKELADNIGHWLGYLAISVPANGGRTTTAALLEEVLRDPQRWPLLRTPETRSELLRCAAFRMKEYVKDRWEQTEVAADFASWNQSIWQHLQTPDTKENPSDHVVLYALHWLEQNHQEPPPGTEKPLPPDPAVLRVWWEHLLPFWQLVIETGHQADVFTIFFALRPRLMNHIVRSDEVLGLVGRLLDRLQEAIDSGKLQSDQLGKR